MNENLELLEFVFENAEMGAYSTTELLKVIKEKENKLKPLLQIELKEYEKHMAKCQKMLQNNNVDPSTIGMMAKMGSKMGIMMETLKDNSDSALAQMLIQGLTMGSVTLTSKIDKYEKCTDKKIMKVAKNYLVFLEKEIERLKEYL